MPASEYQETISYPPASAYDSLIDQVERHDMTHIVYHGMSPFRLIQQMWMRNIELGSYPMPECLRDEFAAACQPFVGRNDVDLGVGMCPLGEISAISDDSNTTCFAQTVEALRAIIALITTNIRWRCWNNGTGSVDECSTETSALQRRVQ